MLPVSRACALLSAAALAVTTLVASPSPGSAGSPRAASHPHPGMESAQVVLDWETTAFRTVYTEGLTPIPVGIPVLGFTSLAMYDAATHSWFRRQSSESAAVATAAHDVLLHYYPASVANLDADLAATLALVPDGPAETIGARIGAWAAAKMIASRAGDHYLDPDIHYTLPPGIGIWQPTPPATDMLGAWIGSLRTVVLRQPVFWAGRPDPVTSAAYAEDFNEVKAVGRKVTTPTDQSLLADFFNSNSATMVGDALIRYLETNPLSLLATAKLFGTMHGALTDTIIRCWQLKRDVGFWRPSSAIAQADADGNPDTSSEAGWTPQLTEPNYSDYVSGHACATSSQVETIRRTLGENTPLELISVNSPTHKFYTNLTAVETDALNSRIYGGLHFRKAMDDGYAIGHRTARLVLWVINHHHRHGGWGW